MLVKVGSQQPMSRRDSGQIVPPELFDMITTMFRRHFLLILNFLLVAISLSCIYLITATSKYTADAQMVIDTHRTDISQQQQTSNAGADGIDPGAVETQVAIIQSENISLAVIRDLHLEQDPEFIGAPDGFLSSLMDRIASLLRSPSLAEDSDQPERKALLKFEKMEDVRRVGMTYVMDVAFTSEDPSKAAKIANAIADAYVTDQLESKYQVVRRASAWLQDRINELRVQSASAERAVVDFKSKNNIIDSGGRLMNEQQLTEISSQLVEAKAATAEAEARYNRIKDLTKQDIPDASVADSLKNDVIIRLRGQYVDLAAKEGIWSQKYGVNHQATVNVRNEMSQIAKSISGELDRIANSYFSDVAIARTRQQSIEQSLASLIADAQVTNKSSIQLRELESSAQTSRTMYDTLLQRYMEAVQQQSFPITESRLISPASKPLGRSSPKTLLVLAGGIFAGLLAGFGVAYSRDRNDKVFRTAHQIEDKLDLPCLAFVPRLALQGSADNLPVDRGRIIGNPMYSYVIEKPLSPFSESVRSIKVAVDMKSGLEPGRVVGITSSVPNEGKSTISSNLAYLLANGGARVVLIDADLRNPNLSRRVFPGQEFEGLMTACKSNKPLAQYIHRDEQVGLDFVSSGSSNKQIHTYEALSSAQMNALIAALKSSYDYIIVDLPPLHPIVDARGSVRFIDDYVFVVEWGKTEMEMVERCLRSAPEILEKTIGAVLNKSDVGRVGRYDGVSTSRYKQYYGRYDYAA